MRKLTAATTLVAGMSRWVNPDWRPCPVSLEKTSQDASVPVGSTSAYVPGRHRNQVLKPCVCRYNKSAVLTQRCYCCGSSCGEGRLPERQGEILIVCKFVNIHLWWLLCMCLLSVHCNKSTNMFINIIFWFGLQLKFDQLFFWTCFWQSGEVWGTSLWINKWV